MPASARAIPNHVAPYGADDSSQRPRTLYVDFAMLETAVSGPDAVRIYKPATPASSKRPSRVTTVGREADGLRRNVRDAARAVLTWLASVTQHDAADDLDRVLDRCLRPGPDAPALNYTALAQEINDTLGLDLSAKRVQTAVRHLREASTRQTSNITAAPAPTLAQRFDALYAQLRTNHDGLIREQKQGGHVLSRAVTHDVLCVLRSAAGRLIECGFGEGIPQHADLDATRQRFLGFVRRVMREGYGADSRSTLREDIARLLKALHDHDGSAEADMQLVVSGACIVADLAGPDALPGIMARLNVLMVGRPMLESEFFVEQMLKLADTAGSLVKDRATQTYMAWVRLQPEDRRTPSPNRVRSYCLNNAATHVLQRLHTGELTGAHWFATAQKCYDTMHEHDRGFQLLKTTEAIMLCVLADLTHNAQPARELFQRLGYDKSLGLLHDLARYDNSPDLNRLVRRHADTVYDGIASQLLVLP